MTKYPISTHTFMMPIRWDLLPKGYPVGTHKNSIDFELRTDTQSLHFLLKKSGWNRAFYKIDGDIKRYNEISYFHSYACKTLFDLQFRSEETIDKIDPNKVMIYYEKEITEGAYYEIKTKDKTYKLDLTDLNLHVYNTGVAILAIVCENFNEEYTKVDILKINEFGRRIYPPFLSESNQLLTQEAKSKMLASSLALWCGGESDLELYEDFSWYDDLSENNTFLWENGSYQYNNFIVFPQIIQGLFDKNFTFDAQGEFDELNQRENKVRFNIIGDDRMFFQCWYGNNELSRGLGGLKGKNSEFYDYEESKFWYAFMNGDTDPNWPTLQHNAMLKTEIAKSTYARWANYGTLNGFTRDSFVAISNDVSTLLANGAPNLCVQFTSIYYQMAMISLAQRASILRFSSEISNLGDIGKNDPNHAKDLIEKLYLNYIEFVNKIYHREVTPTIQGIEMYDQFQAVMRVEKDATSLKYEIQELYNFAQSIKQDEISRKQEELSNSQQELTQIATFFLPITLVVAMFSLISDKDIYFEGEIKSWSQFLLIFMFLLIPIVLLFVFKKKNMYEKFINFLKPK